MARLNWVACPNALSWIHALLILTWTPMALGQDAAASQNALNSWTRFRGPNGTGIIEGVEAPATWTAEQISWKTKLPGIGHSSPVAWNNKIFLLSADPETATRYVLCLDSTEGKIVWNQSYASAPHHLHSRNSYASCTPAVDEHHVYVAWSTPTETTFKALKHDGKEVWSLNLGPWVSQHGFGTSPIVFEDLVILFNSQQANQLKPGQKPGESYMMAFDRMSGKLVWKRPRKSVNVCYSVPCIYTPEAGKPELICTSTGDGVFSLNPRTGEENWSIDAFKMRTVSSPVVAGGLIFGSTGSGGGGNYVAAVKPGSNPEIVYEIKRQAPYVPTLITRNDLVFLFYDKGFVSCIDARTGEVHYRERVDAAFSGSPIRVGNKIYCVSESGTVLVVAAEKQFKVLGQNELGENCRSTPAFANGHLLFRTDSHLFAVGGQALSP